MIETPFWFYDSFRCKEQRHRQGSHLHSTPPRLPYCSSFTWLPLPQGRNQPRFTATNKMLQFLLISQFLPRHPFFLPGPNHITVCSQGAFTSSRPRQFLRLSSFLMTLTVPRCTGQAFCRTSLSECFTDAFLIPGLRLQERTPGVKGPSYHVSSRTCAITRSPVLTRTLTPWLRRRSPGASIKTHSPQPPP